MSEKYRVILDQSYGLRHLEPLPSNEELEEFYRRKYYELVKEGGRAPELKRIMGGGIKANAELDWLAKTWWLDIRDVLEEIHFGQVDRNLLDFGCGPGNFASFISQEGWRTIGIEPSDEAADVARNTLGATVYESLDACRMSEGDIRFEAVTLLNVLEHVQDPSLILQTLKGVLKDGATIVIRVPNDFTILQHAAQQKLDAKPWWIAIPDHIHYFNFESLTNFLTMHGFEIVDKLSDFPMELFLLFGDDYVNNSGVGRECHQRRKSFELSISPELRRGIYRCFAQNGIGRNCLVFARCKER